MYALCRRLFVLCVARPVALLWLGLAIRHAERFPLSGPAVVIANHNSHLDTLALLSLFPLADIPKVRIAAAADYFFTTRWTSFIAERFLGLVPMIRGHSHTKDILAPLAAVLEQGDILVLFPEGTRGEAEVMAEIKPGIWHLLKRFPLVPVYPVYLHGMGRSLPKGEWIPVPFFVDVCVGESLGFDPDKQSFMDRIREAFAGLRGQTLAGLRPMNEEEHI